MTVDLRDFDLIVLNTSGGKDSAVSQHLVCDMARSAGVMDRVVSVHADLGDMEWPGVPELAQRQSERCGTRFVKVSRADGVDLLSYIEARGRWPDNRNRYCTSDHKRGPIRTVHTQLVRERFGNGRLAQPARVLNVMGMRAQESPKRAKMDPITGPSPKNGSNGRRAVTDWLPIHGWTEAEVWAYIRDHDLEMHPAYAAGMPRLSCCFCVFASEGALTIAAQRNPQLARRYADAERRMGHTFRNGFSIADLVDRVEAGTAVHVGTVADWAA